MIDRGRNDGREPATAGAPGLEDVGPGLDRRLPDRVLRPRPARLPDLQRRPPDPRASGRPRGPDALHRRGRQQRPEGLPQQRADGVRLDLRARRLPRARLHGRLPPPRRRIGRAPVRRGRVRPSPRADDRRLPGESLRRAGRHPHLHRTAGRGVCGARAPLRRVLLEPDDRPGPAPRRDRRPRAGARADRVLLLVGLGSRRPPAGPQLLLHEQLAPRGAGR